MPPHLPPPATLATVGLLTLLASTRIHDYLTGRCLIRDTADRVRLATRSLHAWDDAWAANPLRSDIIVCLTTIPSRIILLEGTLKSLLAQSRSPRAIRLHLPLTSSREDRPYDIPAPLRSLRSLEIVPCTDWGPATKLIPALYDLPAHQPLLIVDDDMRYPSGLVDHFHRAAMAHPDVALGSSGWIVPADLTDRPTTLLTNILQVPPVPLKSTRLCAPRRVDILQGYSGYLVRPAFFDLADLTDYSQGPPEARLVDDVWISVHCRAARWVLPADRYCFESIRHGRFFRQTGLGRLNSGNGDPDRRNNTIVIRAFRDRWMICRREECSPPRGNLSPLP